MPYQFVLLMHKNRSMSYATDHIATILKNAREANGLSQRALSGLAGMPQSHISKIENGAVDLRLTSLVELARALDMELTLVPRKSLPAVNSIVRGTKGEPRRVGKRTAAIGKEFKRLQANLNRVLHKYPTNPELAQFQRAIHDLQNLRFNFLGVDELQDANRAIDRFIEHEDPDGLRHALLKVKNLRNAAVHSSASAPADTVRPAYALEKDEHGQ